MRTERWVHAGVHWVNDAYNANPDSMRAGIDCFLELCAGVPPAERLLILGDMREQGDLGPAAHDELLAWTVARAGGAAIIVVGALMSAAAAAHGLPAFADAAAAVGYVRERVRPGQWVFVKGSRGLHLETLLPPKEEVPS
jgi:UDP-N-acetylmuramoyl-tripeptide--D-alanyl-D-alanine ligase